MQNIISKHGSDVRGMINTLQRVSVTRENIIGPAEICKLVNLMRRSTFDVCTKESAIWTRVCKMITAGTGVHEIIRACFNYIASNTQLSKAAIKNISEIVGTNIADADVLSDKMLLRCATYVVMHT